MSLSGKTLQYFGGKTKISNQIVEYLESVRRKNQVYVEPFVGGAIICSKMSGKRKAYDYNEYLITMYKAVQGGVYSAKCCQRRRV